jgi:hypothetical protein
LSWTTPANAYYRVKRATELILRSWRSQDIQLMARLARWLYYALMSSAELGLALSDSYHFLEPNESTYHAALIERLSPRLQAKWNEIHAGPKGRVLEVLDSTRNRMEPFFASPVLRRIFGATDAALEMHALRRDARIVLLNLNPGDVLDLQLADTIGSVFLNELFRSAQTQRSEPFPTYVFLDEFQNFVSPDLVDMLPAVRQLGLRMVLSHQSFTQLKRGDIDLSALIFQAQNRLCFGLQGPDDADLMAHELASCTFDEKAIKHIQYTWRQLVTGFDREILHGGAEGTGWSTAQTQTDGRSQADYQSTTYPPDMFGTPIQTRGESRGQVHSAGQSQSEQGSRTASWHESLAPQYDTFQEPRITFQTFQEWRQIWAREIRRAPIGQAMLQREGDPEVYTLQIRQDNPAYLKYDQARIATHFPQLLEAKQHLIEENFKSDLFLPASTIDAQTDARIRRVLQAPGPGLTPSRDDSSTTSDPFR